MRNLTINDRADILKMADKMADNRDGFGFAFYSASLVDFAIAVSKMPIECTCAAKDMPFGRCCKAPTSSAVIASLEMALSQAAAMIERQQHVMQRAIDAWDSTTHQKNGDGRLWQCMEELRGECGKQPNT